MEKKILKNININMMITIIISLLSFIINKNFAKYMGVEELGLMRLFTQLIAYLNLAELGLGTASTYALYKPLAEKNIKKINTIVSTINSFYNGLAFFIFIVGMLINILLPLIIKEINLNTFKIFIYWSLYVLSVSSSYFGSKYSILFTANQEYMCVRKIQGFSRILFQSIQIAILLYTQSFIFFIIVMTLENLIIYIMYRKYFKKNYNYIEKVKEREVSIYKDIKNIFWHKIGTVIVFNTDYIIITKFLSLGVVGIYSSYLMIGQMILTLVSVLSSVLTPIIGNYIAVNNKENVYLFWKKLNSIYIFLGCFICSCVYLLSSFFVQLWLGKEYILPKFTILLITINLFMQIIRQMIEIFKINSGFFDDKYVPLLESLINLILSLYLVKAMGLNGVIMGTVISNIIIILFLKPILVFKRCFNKEAKEYMNYLIKYVSITGVALFTIIIFFNRIYNKEFIYTWYYFLKYSFVIVGVSLIFSIIFFILDKDFRSILKQIKLCKSIKI